MCGIVGYLRLGEAIAPVSDNLINEMSDTIIHRGPDGGGVWQDVKRGIALGHRRLAILDTTDAGHQPMMSQSQRFTVVFNGEIYNFIDLKNEINQKSQKLGKRIIWRGHSDTEVLLNAIECFGLLDTVKKCRGMFALAVWDSLKQSITLVRDRFGEKPLYYSWGNGYFIFGSELKSFLHHPAFNKEIDRASVALQLQYGYIPAPYTIFKNARKLLPGSMLKVDKSASVNESKSEEYWSFKKMAELRNRDLEKISEEEAISGLNRILIDVVQEQMVADVPVGVFLSGGTDSSMIASLMQSKSVRPIKTFTIGFGEKEFNEAQSAKEIADYLGTDHTEMYISHQDAMEVIPTLPTIYDEPFSDPSQIPTAIVSKLTRKSVTVALSGDGGDEMFCGYNRYTLLNRRVRQIKAIPQPLKKLFAISADFIPCSAFDFVLRGIGVENGASKMNKIKDIMSLMTKESVYKHLVTHWKNPHEVVKNFHPHSTLLSQSHLWNQINVDSFEHTMMVIDTLTYLVDDILVKVDRAAMAASLETRVPFLDPRIAFFAWGLPLDFKLRDGKGKWILKKVLARYLPERLVDKPKRGFAVPIGEWLRTGLRDWAEMQLSESRLRSEGVFDTVIVSKMWREHLSRKADHQFHLWDVLMFQSWLDHYKIR
jgi:asparagine synthase (glutamine-hydrolysing)